MFVLVFLLHQGVVPRDSVEAVGVVMITTMAAPMLTTLMIEMVRARGAEKGGEASHNKDLGAASLEVELKQRRSSPEGVEGGLRI